MRYLAVDTETTGVDLHKKDRAFAVSMADEDGNEFYYETPVSTTRTVSWSKKAVSQIWKTISQYDALVFHNAKFDIRALELIGLPVVEKFIQGGMYEDTLLASHVLWTDIDHGLKSLARNFLGFPIGDEEALKEAVRAARRKAPPSVVLGEKVECDFWLPKLLDPANTTCRTYAVQDAQRTIALWVLFRQALADEGLQQP